MNNQGYIVGMISALIGGGLTLFGFAQITKASKQGDVEPSAPPIEEEEEEEEKAVEVNQTKEMAGEDELNQLTSQQLRDVLKSKKKDTTVLFYANWCPHCISMHGDWKELVKKCKEDNIPCYSIDLAIEKDANFGVRSFPTIIKYKIDGTEEPFKGKRTFEELYKFVKK